MYFHNVIGNNDLKRILIKEVDNGRIPHAQLFNDSNGCGLPMAIAFSMYLFCSNKSLEVACGQCSSCYKILKLNHPDLHFFYPTIGYTKESGSKATFSKFQKIILNNPYLDVPTWAAHNKMKSAGQITVKDAAEINKTSSLKAYEGKYKVFIIWQPETMQGPAITKLLKTIEEPTANTFFILISNNADLLIPTILSRLQVKELTKISDSILIEKLQAEYPQINLDIIKNYIIEHGNNYNKINAVISGEFNQEEISRKFINWIRLCFLSIKKKSIPELINWCDHMANDDKHVQLCFAESATEIIRYAFLLNYNPPFKLGPNLDYENFNLNTFSSYIHPNNIFEMCTLLNQCYSALNRRSPANAKILFLDLSFAVGKLLYKRM